MDTTPEVTRHVNQEISWVLDKYEKRKVEVGMMQVKQAGVNGPKV